MISLDKARGIMGGTAMSADGDRLGKIGQVYVPVTREQIRIEREPISAADIAGLTTTGAADGPSLREEEHEIVLHAEHAVVEELTVPVERVRLDTDMVTERETVTEDIRKELIEVRGVDAVDPRERRAADTVSGSGARTDERLR